MTLAAFSVVVLGLLVNWLAAALLAFTVFFYVVVYTMWLKRATPQNIVIGGAAGAFPPMIGWAAATGGVSIEPCLLFFIIFFWTPPHFWALALLIRDNYAAAKVPMLPVVRGERETLRQILVYTLVLIAVTLLPFAWGTLGAGYAVAALALGGTFLVLTLRLRRAPSRPRASLLFHYSLLYLALLFVAMAVDVL
jgi:protoheme IX farnesyltransferase